MSAAALGLSRRVVQLHLHACAVGEMCVENVRRMTTLDQTAAGRCAVVVDTLHVTLKFTIAASASITGVATSSVRPAPSSFRSTDAAERLHSPATGTELVNCLSASDRKHSRCCC